MKKQLLRIAITSLLFASLMTESSMAVTDILRYRLYLEEVNHQTKTIRAKAEIQFKIDGNQSDSVVLSLQGFIIDSLQASVKSMEAIYQDNKICLRIPSSMKSGDTASITVVYHGTPATDPSDWGGFYFRDHVAFNLGVGFASDPHPYGRSWFPANDVFTDRAQFEFYITTAAHELAMANGLLIDQVSLPGDRIRWHWMSKTEIPSYLAGISIGPYELYSDSVDGITIQIAYKPSARNRVKSSFRELKKVTRAMIDAWGPYPFEKIGYSLVPFEAGAMEHAGNISIGEGLIQDDLNSVSLWAHELSHAWFGNLVTCKKAEEMWLNEGFARFNEAFVAEILEGKKAYRTACEKIHREAIRSLSDPVEMQLNLVQLPHQKTYSRLAYDKGADVLIMLRKQLGDSLFFGGIKSYLHHYAFENVSSENFIASMNAYCHCNLDTFLGQWLNIPGYPVIRYRFSVDHTTTGFLHKIDLFQTNSTGQKLRNLSYRFRLQGANHDTLLNIASAGQQQTIYITLPWKASGLFMDEQQTFPTSGAISPILPLQAKQLEKFPDSYLRIQANDKALLCQYEFGQNAEEPNPDSNGSTTWFIHSTETYDLYIDPRADQEYKRRGYQWEKVELIRKAENDSSWKQCKGVKSFMDEAGHHWLLLKRAASGEYKLRFTN